ncbi:uncharacterized protein BDW43DRAFT_291884 [Aspergillus alliaceus]|uniref:uncharacterized protein n=1 Tax=Petromyces alliaceus TaxID=209559 RepID=UPI0012A53EE8|nr:uncharacterized protein BDW43DRAFT_291884 [Aspergillus alliaceus]KAB8228261.1 hypothetical protein BDW43DRAFT_291884 [Aspergillus alliaceus]
MRQRKARNGVPPYNAPMPMQLQPPASFAQSQKFFAPQELGSQDPRVFAELQGRPDP